MATILTIDADPDYGTLIGSVLGKKGHKIINFTEAEPALEEARRQPLDLAILETRFNKLNLPEVLEQLGQLHPDLRVAILTDQPTTATARQAIRLGVQEYLVKPVDGEELETRVTRVLKATKRTIKEALAL